MNRLYENGMLSSGEARHCTAWDFPSLPKLQPVDIPQDHYQRQKQHVPARWQHRRLARIFDVLRAR